MEGYHLPSVETIATLSAVEQVQVLDALFEPCAALHGLSLRLLQEHTFQSYEDLVESVRGQLDDLRRSESAGDQVTLLEILNAHPRLGEKAVVSVQSRGEQAQLDTGGPDGAERLRQLNASYEKAFGFRYVVFVDGRGRPEIMRDMESRIKESNVDFEKARAIMVRVSRKSRPKIR